MLVFGCLQSRKPLEARERTLESETVPGQRVSLESKERKLLCLEATLSYLGLGIPPDIPTWGAMVAQGHRVMVDGWWLATFPGFAIAMLVISLGLVGDGLFRRS